ncbi:MAG: hypothetical protein HZB46_02445 [Solirubrobacterales bacterium]|nr:hypothetical protein [Solirubrobacterales bacterium]
MTTLSDIDLLALSDQAWDVVDPAAEHEAEEETWTAALRHGWPPPETVDDLRAHLDEVASSVQPRPPALPLRAVAAVMAFLAGHPERRDAGDALLLEAVREAYGDAVPDDVAAWLAVRRRAPEAHRRRHGAPGPRRSGARPSAPDAT